MTLKDLPNCFAYLDDIIIFSSGSVEDHLAKLEKVFERLHQWGWKLKPKKCHLLQRRIKYLGHVVSENGVEADPEKIEAVRKWPLPTTVQELRQALGFFGYYRKFVKDFSKLAKPLNDLLKGMENKSQTNKKTPVTMTPEATAAFELLREKLCSPPILAFADYSRPFQLHTDASAQGLGAVLYQEQDGHLRVIAYASRGLKPSESHYPAHKLEFLALKWSVCEKFQDYLYGNTFTVFTDSNPMSYVMTTAKLDATGHRWLAELSRYNFDIKYRSGKANTDADVMSRLPTPSDIQEINRDVVVAISSSIHAAASDVLLGVTPQLEEKYAGVNATTTTNDKDIASTTLWKDRQAKDPVLTQLISLVKSAVKPIVSQCAESIKPYLREWERLVLEDGVLYRKRKEQIPCSLYYHHPGEK